MRRARDRGARAPRARLPGRRTDELLPVGGVYAWRRDGEHHMWNPETIALVQHAVRAANGDVGAALTRRRAARYEDGARRAPAFEKYREYARAINEDAARKATLRGLLEIGPATGDGARADRARAGRAGERDRQALLHRRDEPRLDLARGARDARDRDEPPRRALEHGRGRRGPRRASRPTPTATAAARRSSRSPRGASA